MITGFNTNVRHRDRTFHVQTEDSGRKHPHIISHVYFGGTILASEKQEYGELLEDPDLAARVRSLMEDQHKALVLRLQSGKLDDVIQERLGVDPSEVTGSATEQKVEAAEVSDPPVPDPVPEALDPGARPVFGANVGSEKPLDEVILEYLVEKARRRPAKAGAGTASRRKG